MHQNLLGYKAQEKLRLGAREQKGLIPLVYTVGSQMAVRLSALRAGRSLSPVKYSGTSVKVESTRGHSAAGRIR
jgi:hypothetical protein